MLNAQSRTSKTECITLLKHILLLRTSTDQYHTLYCTASSIPLFFLLTHVHTHTHTHIQFTLVANNIHNHTLLLLAKGSI